MGTMRHQHDIENQYGKERATLMIACVRTIAPRFSFSHQISHLLLLVDMYWTGNDAFLFPNESGLRKAGV